RTGPPTVGGRWSLLPAREPDTTVRAHALARTLLDRHGVVTRGAVGAEGVEGGFSAVYRILSAFEETGQARRGYVVEGLGAAQFAMDGAVDRLRAAANARDRGDVAAPAPFGAGDSGSPAGSGPDAFPGQDGLPAFPPEPGPDGFDGAYRPGPGDYVSPRDRPRQPAPPPWQNGGRPSYDPFAGRRTGPDDASRAVVLAAADPANAYGAALSWPEPPDGAGHKPGRKAGSLVVLVDGELTLYMERGGKTLLAWPADPDGEPADDARLPAAAQALAAAARAGSLGMVTVERVNGTPSLTSPLGALLEGAGFVATPR
ncbi:DEAD/DEAH box helicase, partial [Streptomyces sp. SID8111]|nr:DEAD/DEAH box helicase [Streptomyces sp. SID8111]